MKCLSILATASVFSRVASASTYSLTSFVAPPSSINVHVVSSRVISCTRPKSSSNTRPPLSNVRISSGSLRTPSSISRNHIKSTSSSSSSSLQATSTTYPHTNGNNNNNNNPYLARRERFLFNLKTLTRVLLPAIVAGVGSFLALPAICFRVANFVTRVTDPVNIPMLSDAVQSFISLVGLLYSILVGQVFGFLYSQQEVSFGVFLEYSCDCPFRACSWAHGIICKTDNLRVCVG